MYSPTDDVVTELLTKQYAAEAGLLMTSKKNRIRPVNNNFK
jgi:hypothetical protein